MNDEQTTARVFYNLERAPVALKLPDRAPLAFHQRLDGYTSTPLLEAPEIARHLGLSRVLLKVESQRLGLPAFKILGASWAIYRALQARLPDLRDDWQTFGELVTRIASLKPITLAAATDHAEQ